MKRIISFIIVFCLTISGLNCFAANTSVLSTVNDEAYEIISKLEIISNIKEGKNISRADFVMAIVKTFGFDGYRGSEINSVFSDVNEGHRAYNSISIAYDLNLISDADDKMFLPDLDIRLDEAVKVVVCALNIRAQAEAEGGFPYGYLAIANRKKLLKDVNTDNTFLSNRDAVMLIYNTLNSEYIGVSGISSDNTGNTVHYNETGKTVLEEVFDIYCIRAQVVAGGVTNILGLDNNSAGNVTLKECTDGTLYNIRDTDGILTKKVGEQMEVYVKRETAGDTYNCFAAFSYDQKVEVFDGTNISLITLEDDEISLYTTENDGKEKLVEYSYTSSITVILNDLFQFNVTPAFDILKQEDTLYNIDSVKIIDIEGDGRCDVLSVYAYRNYIADFVDPVWDNVRLRGSEEAISIDREENNVYQPNGEAAISDYIVNDSVISVYERNTDDNDVKNDIYVSNDYTEGIIEMISFDDKTVTVAGKKLKFSADADEYFSELEAGKEYRFLKDHNGIVAYAKKVSVSNPLEGYFVVDKFTINRPGLEYELLLKVFDINKGKVVILEKSDDIDIDGVTYDLEDSKKRNAVSNLLSGVNLVYIKLNGKGEIREIKLPAENSGDFRYAMGVKGYIEMRYKSSDNVFYKELKETSSAYNILADDYRTKVVIAPTSNEADDEIREKTYKNTTIDYFVNDLNYSVEGYVLKENGIMSDIIIAYVDPDKHSPIVSKTQVFVVDYVGEAVNLAGEIGKLVVGYQSGQPRSYVSQDNNFKTIGGDIIELKPGDVFKPQLDSFGDCSAVEMIYRASTGEVVQSNPTAYGSSMRTYKGRVYNADGNFFSVVADSQIPNISDNMSGKLNSYSGASAMYYFDPDKEPGRRVRVGTTADMKTYVKTGMNASEVIMLTAYGVPRTAIIIE